MNPRFLSAISELPKVNPDWLKTGHGEPLLAPRDEPTDKGWAVPVASALLPGLPAENEHLLTPRVEYLPGSVYRPGLYAVEAAACMPAVSDPVERMAQADLVIIDADPARWRQNLQALAGRLCVIRQHVGEADLVTLRRVFVDLDSSTGQPRLVTPSDLQIARDQEIAEEQRSDLEKYGKYKRSIRWLNDISDNAPVEMQLEAKQIIGVAVQLIRTYD